MIYYLLFGALMFVALKNSIVRNFAIQKATQIGYKIYTSSIGLHIHKLTMSQSSSSVMPHSKTSISQFAGFRVLPVPILSDNYSYIIIDQATNQAAVVDPADANIVLNEIQKLQVKLTHILTTHKHWDHAGGNKDIQKVIPQIVITGSSEVESANMVVKNGSVLRIGETQVEVMETPAHTLGHVVYSVKANQSSSSASSSSSSSTTTTNETKTFEEADALFTGDTMFSAGCGKFFEGTAEQMYRHLVQRIASLPDRTVVFCGHEYTLSNLRYAVWVEPDNEHVRRKLEQVIKLREERQSTMPCILGEEKKYNPFLRVNVLHESKRGPVYRELAQNGAPDPVAVMSAVRRWKDEQKHAST